MMNAENMRYLITCAEWLGPSRDAPQGHELKPIERTVAFSYRGDDLSAGLRMIKQYSDDYKRKFYPLTAVEFRLIGVSEIYCDQDALDALGVTSLPIDTERS